MEESMSQPNNNSATPLSTYDENEIVNHSANPHISDVLAGRLNRRHVLRGGLGATTAMMLGATGLAGCGGGGGGNSKPAGTVASDRVDSNAALVLGFNAVAKNKLDLVSVPDGYSVKILHALGDPLKPGEAAWANDGSESAESYNHRFGDGHDGMYFFGMSENERYQPERSDRGLLAVNHEYVVGPYAMHPNGRTSGASRVPAEAEKEIYAHGVSVCEVRRGANGNEMSVVIGSRFNRRITSATEMEFGGPATGNPLLQTHFSPDGTHTRGTNNNCANGYTPWGTYLTCEENFLNSISRADGDDALRTPKELTALRRYGLPQISTPAGPPR
jgi:uncharacterized protein